MSSSEYNFSEIEKRWQKFWADDKTFRAENKSDKPKFYVLDMFPYPSAAGLHIGHPEGYTGSDILARYKRAKGFNVLHPMGWDAFGLPAEQYAIKTGNHPRGQTLENIDNFRRQLQMLGFAIDWEREIATIDSKYFKWTQWIFLNLFKHGLAYVDDKPVWFCPELGTVLANEEVLNTDEGPRSERGNFPVERRPIRQWVLKITAYAEKLIAGLDALNWPDSTKRLQKNWIGRSEGAEVEFPLADDPATKLKIFTTRPDTLYGVTYMVIAPEHPLRERLTAPEKRAEVEAYVEKARNKSDLERTDLAKEKTGVFTGCYAINPLNGDRVPVWVADYVLMGYGTGAIMAVPAHDERDWDFAKAHNIPIIQVVDNPDAKVDVQEASFVANGVLVNSGKFTGMPTSESKKAITKYVEEQGWGRGTVNYKLRDWLFSRQRYWGEPFPIVWVSENDYEKIPADSALREFMPQEKISYKTLDGETLVAVALPASALPLELPEVESYKPSGTGESPLANAKGWVNVFINLATGETRSRAEGEAAPEGWVAATRETNTMPQWAGSCWYYLRYLSPDFDGAPVEPEAFAYWKTPDFYIGGAEHAVLHLLYARFWHRFLYDIGVLSTPEPFTRLFHQGIILGEDGEKMSKSRGNVVNPDQIVADYGTDALRLYLMFLGPLEAMKPWNTKGIEGVARLLRRLWRQFIDETTGTLSARISDSAQESSDFQRVFHQSIKKISSDIESLGFNTAISQYMILMNALEKEPAFTRETARGLLKLIAPFAPHIAEELWSRLGETGSVCVAAWPVCDEAKLVEDSVTIVFSVNGKRRSEAKLPVGATKDAMIAAAKADTTVQKFIDGKEIVREIVVPGKLVNIVVK
ncbi:MAG: leucine--tRNA ligase [Verrucomicrobia bacterium]|nr:leucine--tRNA ligase [Verrucomicrobiota bacterium]